MSGMARVLDLGCTLNEYNYPAYPEKADYHALYSDWKLVGCDIREAMAQYDNQIDSHGEK